MFHGRNALWGQLDVDYKEIERYLATAKIISVTPDENAGRTEPWIILLDDGRIKRRGYFKHVSRCRPNPLPDCYKYEIAAYELSMLLDIKCVPPTVERKIEGISGSLQLWVEDSEKLKNVLEKNMKLLNLEKFNHCMLDGSVFQNLVYFRQSDEDVLVDLEEGTVCRIDFSEAFSPEHKLIQGFKMVRSSEKFYQNLVRLRDKDIRSRLESYLNKDELEAVIARKKLIIKKLSKKMRQQKNHLLGKI